MSRRLPPLNALRAFEAAARHASFARAAEELHVTPAAVSQQIKQLEAYLGVRLFRRGKTLTLSEAASASLPLLSDAFEQLERAAAGLRPRQGDGPLVVSTPPTFASRWLIARLDDFQIQHPDIELRLLATRRLVDFALEDVDVAVRFGPGPFDGLHAERLMPEAIIPVVAPRLADGLHTPADLVNSTLLYDNGSAWDPAFPDWETLLVSLGISWSAPLRVRYFDDSNLLIQAVTSGLGVGLVWRSLVVDDLAAGRVVHLFDRFLPTSHGYHLVIPPNRLSLAKVASFREWMLEQGARQGQTDLPAGS